MSIPTHIGVGEFDRFEFYVREAGLEARKCNSYSWQIVGGEKLVFFYPATHKRPSKYFVVNSYQSSQFGEMETAIAAAGKRQPGPIRESKFRFSVRSPEDSDEPADPRRRKPIGQATTLYETTGPSAPRVTTPSPVLSAEPVKTPAESELPALAMLPESDRMTLLVRKLYDKLRGRSYVQSVGTDYKNTIYVYTTSAVDLRDKFMDDIHSVVSPTSGINVKWELTGVV
jgi:hypothetical protein